MWFNQIAQNNNPGRDDLKMFVCNMCEFFDFVLNLNRKDFSFLWEESPDLQVLARDTFRRDICKNACIKLRKAIDKISTETLHQHGLEGRPLRFKFKVLDSIGNQWKKIKDELVSIRKWFKKIIDAIDAVLDSLIDATGGTGGLIKEFKDALRALA